MLATPYYQLGNASMVVSEHTERFFGLPIINFQQGDQVLSHQFVHRLIQEYEAEQTQRELLDEYLRQAKHDQLRALVIGGWGDAATGTPPDGYLEGLVEARLPRLGGLYVGDMTFEEAEISWINQSNYTALLAAYPALEALRIRGSTALTLPVLDHPMMRELAIETGGLPNSVVESITQSRLPALEHLELWLGDDGYGFDGDVETYQRLLEAIKPGRLKYLGLRNAQIADELATYIAKQPWLGKLNTLDLSMGTIGDAGAEALLASPHLKGLATLNLNHHYISAPLVAKLRALPLKLVIGDAEEEDEGSRYVEVGE